MRRTELVSFALAAAVFGAWYCGGAAAGFVGRRSPAKRQLQHLRGSGCWFPAIPYPCYGDTTPPCPTTTCQAVMNGTAAQYVCSADPITGLVGTPSEGCNLMTHVPNGWVGWDRHHPVPFYCSFHTTCGCPQQPEGDADPN